MPILQSGLHQQPKTLRSVVIIVSSPTCMLLSWATRTCGNPLPLNRLLFASCESAGTFHRYMRAIMIAASITSLSGTRYVRVPGACARHEHSLRRSDTISPVGLVLAVGVTALTHAGRFTHRCSRGMLWKSFSVQQFPACACQANHLLFTCSRPG